VPFGTSKDQSADTLLKETAKSIKELQEIHVFYSPKEDEFLFKAHNHKPYGNSKAEKAEEHILPKEVVGLGNYTLLVESTSKGRWWEGNLPLLEAGGLSSELATILSFR
jgi:hypothetical protein